MTDDDTEYLMERAAIREYDGEQSEDEARRGAFEDLRRRQERTNGQS